MGLLTLLLNPYALVIVGTVLLVLMVLNGA
jgi:hypothetical protein